MAKLTNSKFHSSFQTFPGNGAKNLMGATRVSYNLRQCTYRCSLALMASIKVVFLGKAKAQSYFFVLCYINVR